MANKNKKELIELISSSPQEAIKFLQGQKDEKRDTFTDHSVYDKCIETALDELDEDDNDTYVLLDMLVTFPNMKTKLFSISPEELETMSVYKSMSPFDKINKIYIKSIEDEDLDRRLEEIVDYCNANHRYSLIINTDNTIVGHSKLEELLKTKKNKN